MTNKNILILVLGVVFSWGMLTAGHATTEFQIPKVATGPVLIHHHSYFVSLKGKSTAKGSRKSPWDLQTALSQPSVVQPGDTIIIEGGNYIGNFTSTLTGTKASPITVRSIVKGRVIIKNSAKSNVTSLVIKGSWATYINLVIDGTDPLSLVNTAVGNKFIHVIVNNAQLKSDVLNVKGKIKSITDRAGNNKTILGNVVSGS